jgi:hypothetical protein
MQKRLKSLFGALLVASLLASCFVSARADVNTQPVPFSFTAASGTSPQVGCSGANLAVITITSGGGATLTVKGSSDAVIGGTYLTNTAFGTNGVITAPGSSTQWPGSTAVYPVGFEFTYTGNSGTLAGSMVCSAAAGVASASGGASTVTCATPGCNVIVTNATTAPFGSAQPVTIASLAPVTTAPPYPAPLATSVVLGSNASQTVTLNGQTTCDVFAGSVSGNVFVFSNGVIADSLPIFDLNTASWSTTGLLTTNHGYAINTAGLSTLGFGTGGSGGISSNVYCSGGSVGAPNAFASAQPVTIASTAPVHDAAPVQPSPLYTMPVTTPAPAPTISPGLYTGTTIACPSAAPAAVNATYTCVHDASGFESVGGPCTGQLPFVSLALVAANSVTLAVALSAGKRILVCSVDGYVAGTTTSSWDLYYSTSSTCASANTILWAGADSGFATTQQGFNKAFFSPLATPAGDSLCYAYGGSALTTTIISIQYVQLT